MTRVRITAGRISLTELELSNDQDTPFHKEIRHINQMLWKEGKNSYI